MLRGGVMKGFNAIIATVVQPALRARGRTPRPGVTGLG
ncbi:hypothetical protein SBD_0870 [Streptomyces bottropensis ATCC 25435]|uniref:Uncharacterized protein n=1 Tax=Streptomyces bottropensis ATCC 25435 TaxID=1054862 RepID=M3F952_9ACTN|nr:hypothetical protein SBD_0870 [Streptomyces bottropensis ATCC 25435]